MVALALSHLFARESEGESTPLSISRAHGVSIFQSPDLAISRSPELTASFDYLERLSSDRLAGWIHSVDDSQLIIGKAIEQAFGRPATRDELDAATAQMTCDLAAAGIQIVRVHAVAQVRAALQQSATIGP